jgi:glutamate synthase domain-containing protein 2
MSERGDNHLPELADGIRKAHAAVIEAEHRCAEAAMEAGALLNEAKALVKHGEWTQWLAENTGFSGRTARRYMQIAASSFKTATVADLGIRRTAEIL